MLEDIPMSIFQAVTARQGRHNLPSILRWKWEKDDGLDGIWEGLCYLLLEKVSRTERKYILLYMNGQYIKSFSVYW